MHLILSKFQCRASSSKDRLISPSEHSGSSAALASARADAAQLKEENTRLLDLLSTVSILSAYELLLKEAPHAVRLHYLLCHDIANDVLISLSEHDNRS